MDIFFDSHIVEKDFQLFKLNFYLRNYSRTKKSPPKSVMANFCSDVHIVDEGFLFG